MGYGKRRAIKSIEAMTDRQRQIADCYMENGKNGRKCAEVLGTGETNVYNVIKKQKVADYIRLKSGVRADMPVTGKIEETVDSAWTLRKLKGLHDKAEKANNDDLAMDALKQIKDHQKAFKEGADEWQMRFSGMSTGELKIEFLRITEVINTLLLTAEWRKEELEDVSAKRRIALENAEKSV